MEKTSDSWIDEVKLQERAIKVARVKEAHHHFVAVRLGEGPWTTLSLDEAECVAAVLQQAAKVSQS